MDDQTRPLPLPDGELNSLLDTLGHLHAELEAEKRYRAEAEQFRVETERVVARSNRLAAITLAVVVAFWLYAAAVGVAARHVTRKIAECTNPPAHPAPASTPLNKLNCYERGQRQTAAAVAQIRDLIDATIQQRLLETLDAARTGKPVTFGPPPTLPASTTTVPSGTSRTGTASAGPTTTTVPKVAR